MHSPTYPHVGALDRLLRRTFGETFVTDNQKRNSKYSHDYDSCNFSGRKASASWRRCLNAAVSAPSERLALRSEIDGTTEALAYEVYSLRIYRPRNLLTRGCEAWRLAQSESDSQISPAQHVACSYQPLGGPSVIMSCIVYDVGRLRIQPYRPRNVLTRSCEAWRLAQSESDSRISPA
jgi:hypothetical protein